jgi:titin
MIHTYTVLAALKGDGIQVGTGGGFNTIGGTESGEGNVISASGGSGVHIQGFGNLVEGNHIGLNSQNEIIEASFAFDKSSYQSPVQNSGDGVLIDGGAFGNLIGGISTLGDTPGNYIGNNAGNGVHINNGSATDVFGNTIGLDGNQQVAPNNGDGVLIEGDNSFNNFIGAATIGAGNVISGNNRNGVNIFGNSNFVQGNIIGLNSRDQIIFDSAGNPVGNKDDGVLIEGAGSANVIGGTSSAEANVISDNGGNGVHVQGSANLVEGNHIGLDAMNKILTYVSSGNTFRVSNGSDGILLNENGDNNTIGGMNGSAGNVVAYNYGNGVDIVTSHNLVAYNTIYGNGGDGVLIYGLTTAKGTFNVVVGNTIGLDINKEPAGNGGNGVLINQGNNNSVGIDPSGAVLGNTIDANFRNGVYITGKATNNQIEGNTIGEMLPGGLDARNQLDGVLIDSQSSSNYIGGLAPGDGNVISANVDNGVHISGVGASGNWIAGNYIGLDSNGRPDPGGYGGNGGDGILIEAASSATPTAGNDTGALIFANTIAGNYASGVHLSGTSASNNAVAGNIIGLNADGSLAVNLAFRRASLFYGNLSDGVLIDKGASGNEIGGTFAVGGITISGNTISGNTGNGVHIADQASMNNLIKGNLIGTNPVGNSIVILSQDRNVDQQTLTELKTLGQLLTFSPTHQSTLASTLSNLLNNRLANLLQADGILVADGVRTTITGNTIAGNFVGVGISGQATGTLVTRNHIGSDLSGTKPLGNIIGVFVDGAASNTIGGSSPGTGNTISGNALVGVEINGQAALSNRVIGNRIGLGANNMAFTTTLSSQSVQVSQSSNAGRRKTNSRSSGTAAPSSQFIQAVGVYLVDTTNNIIGGLAPSQGNVIAGNEAAGVYVFGHGGSSRNNQIIGNWIAMASPGTGPITGVARGQNSQYGVILYNAPQNIPAMSGRGRNHFGKCTIATFREFTGPDPTKGQASSSQASSKSAHASALRRRPVRTRTARK